MFVKTPGKIWGRNPIETPEIYMPDDEGLDDKTNIAVLFFYILSLT